MNSWFRVHFWIYTVTLVQPVFTSESTLWHWCSPCSLLNPHCDIGAALCSLLNPHCDIGAARVHFWIHTVTLVQPVFTSESTLWHWCSLCSLLNPHCDIGAARVHFWIHTVTLVQHVFTSESTLWHWCSTVFTSESTLWHWCSTCSLLNTHCDAGAAHIWSECLVVGTLMMWECLKGCQGNKDHFNKLINTDLVARDSGSCALKVSVAKSWNWSALNYTLTFPFSNRHTRVC